MDRRSDGASRPPASTLYFGGGTPSLMSASGIGAAIAAARSGYGLESGAEITVEANPADLDAAGFERLRSLGVNRISLGAQHFDDGVLAAMGRVHRRGVSKASFAAAHDAGFENVSLDLVLGWPGESPSRWRETLDAVLELGPAHVSLYLLEIDGKNALAHRVARRAIELPDDDLVADLYLQTIDTLEREGLRRYEISNFARAGFESRHNARYWDDGPFLGFGLSAHSYESGRRSWNHATLGRYCSAIEEGRAAEDGARVLTDEERLAEALFTGLRRRDGVDVPLFARRYGAQRVASSLERLRDAQAAGLVEAVGDRLRLTTRGVLLSNEVFRALV